MSTGERENPAAYRALLERLDRWFAGVRAEQPGVVPCAGGCSRCCYGPFDISVADTELLVEAVRALPPPERAEVRARAARVAARIACELPGWGAPHDIADAGDDAFDRAAARLAAEPCPLLDDDGRCRIYADRPLVCRLIGLSMVTPTGRVIENLCPIQDRFPAYQALPPQPFELEDLEIDELEALAAAARRLLGSAERSSYETTISTAITDFVTT